MNTNNTLNYDAAIDTARLLANNWRTATTNRRKLAHSMIVACAVDQYAYGPMKDDVRAKMGKLGKEDANQLKNFFSVCGTVIDQFHTLDATQREAFIKGEYLYSTVYADMKKAEKAKEKKADEEAEIARLAEAGLTAEQDAELKAREGETLANIAAIDRVRQLLGSTDRNDDENKALAGLIDAIAAFSAGVVEEKAAA